MKKQLMDDCFVFSLQNPGHKWRFKTGGTFKKFIIIVIQHKVINNFYVTFKLKNVSSSYRSKIAS